MGKIDQFQVVLDQSNGVYYGGQLLRGHVILHLSESKKLKGLYVEAKGKASVHWSEQHQEGSGNDRRTVTRHYWGDEDYFSFNIPLFGRCEGLFGDADVHPAGVFHYPFQFQLPQTLPSSFEGDYGHIRYYVKGVMDRPWRFNHTTKQPFSVISYLDLNTLPDSRMAPQGQKQKTLCCLCCASGPIEATVQLGRKGYVPGENIIINADVSNATSRQMDTTKAQLVQKTTFYAHRSAASHEWSDSSHHNTHSWHPHSSSRSITRTVAEIIRGPIQAGSEDTWHQVSLHIPPVPPSGLHGCSIIDIKYFLKFVVDPSGPAFDLEIPLDLTIGSVPLQSYYTEYNQAAHSAGYGFRPSVVSPTPSALEPTAPTAPVEAWSPPGYPTGAPPPSYGESVFGQVDYKDKEDNQYTMGQTTYAPVYSYYNWNSNAYSLPVTQTPNVQVQVVKM